jgi:hypothetical protein
MIITVAVASSSSSSWYAAVTDQDPSSSFLSIPITNFGVKTRNLILSVGEKSSSWIG